ncbi:MarR family winged helix-turn-helix transcriptional regulator [Gordonia sp. NPDC003376]
MTDDPDMLADLADAVMELSRKLDPRSPGIRDVIALTGTEVAVIRQVHRHPRITPSRLAGLTGLQRSNISTALRSLEARGMVVREHPDGNARSVELVATELARENLRRLRAHWVTLLSRVDPDVRARAGEVATALWRFDDAIQNPDSRG